MPSISSVPREDESYGSARVIRRSRLFFTVPVIIILIVSVIFFWDIVRANLSPHTLTSWPFRFIITDTSTTATVLAVFISLFMGRLQWARALRPIAGMGIDDEGLRFLPSSGMWRLWIYNAGPGAATIESITYYVRFVDQPESDGAVNWVPISIVNDQLKSRALKDGTDYFIRWYAAGAPFPAVSKYSEGTQIAWFTIRALAQFRTLDVRIRYADSLGDVHEKVTPVIHRLPSVTIVAIKNFLSAASAAP